jgi:hypothetical protein
MANISTMARTTYAITQDDILNGYFGVDMLWDSPFNDTNYNIAWSINDVGQNYLSLDYSTGDIHFKRRDGFIAVVTLPASAPLIQGQYDVVAGIVPSGDLISVTVPLRTLYQVTFYYGPSDNTGNSGETWYPTMSWVDPAGNALELTNPYLGVATGGNVNNYQSYSIPFYAEANTPITLTGTYTGGSFPMNIAVRIVQMSNNIVIPAVGATVTIEAMASHR